MDNLIVFVISLGLMITGMAVMGVLVWLFCKIPIIKRFEKFAIGDYYSGEEEMK